MSLGPLEIVLIVFVVLIFFGPSRLPGLGKSIGSAIRGFKKGISGADEDKKLPPGDSKDS
jgi:sec-independent protein translocase protein TatA